MIRLVHVFPIGYYETVNTPMDIDDLKEKICTAFQKVTPQMLHHTWDAISSRYELYRLCNGGHVEV